MKVVALAQFMMLPTGTLYCKYAPCYTEPMAIKGTNCGPDDFLYQDIACGIDAQNSMDMVDLLNESARSGTSIPIDLDCQGRDGSFDPAQLFLVFESHDLAALIARLQTALHDSTGKESHE